MGRAIVNRNKTGGTNPNIPQTAKVDSRGLVNRMKKGGTMKKAQTGVTTKKGRTTMNIDSSGYAAGKKSGFPAQMISPKTKYSKGDTTNVTVNSKMIKKSIKKAQNGKTTPFQDYVKKYPGSGSDTLTSRNFDPRYNATDAGYFGSKAKQNKDLKDAYSKTYVKKEMTGISQKDQKKYRVQKTGGKTTASMMKKGGTTKKKCC